MSRDELIDSLAVDILGKLPVQYEVWRVRKQFEMNITPSLVVLLQELERFKIYKKIKYKYISGIVYTIPMNLLLRHCLKISLAYN